MVKFNRPAWAFAAMYMQHEEQPNESGLPFGDDAIAAFNEEAARENNKGTSTEQPASVEAASEQKSTKIGDYLLDMTNDIVAPEFRFKIGAVEFCPSGGITAVSGQAKQGKSQFLLVLVATLLSGRDFGDLQRLRPCRSILWVDTEQSKYDVQTNMKRLYQLAGIPEKTDASTIGLHIAHLRDCTPEQRRSIIEDGLNTFAPDMVVIDGIRDLLHNFNDESESETIIQSLLNISAKFPQTNIFCVLHNNPNETKMRGHLGTELLNKCTDRFIVSKETGFFKVKHESRHMEMQGEFTFRIDEKGQLAPYNEFEFLGETPKDIIQSIFEESGETELLFNYIVKTYAKRTGLTQEKAKQAIIDCNNKHDGQLLQNMGKYKFKLSV